MTAIAVLHNGEAMWIATDGAAVDHFKTPSIPYDVTKLICCPEWDCIITGRGRGGAAESFRLRAQDQDITDFDDLLSKASDIARHIDLQFIRYCASENLPRGGADFVLVLCGYSRSRQAFEAHAVTTRAGSIWAGGGGDAPDIEPFAVVQMSNLLLLPQPSDEAAEKFGLTIYRGQPGFAIDDAEIYVQRAIVAARHSYGHARDGSAPTPFVGGFVQLTRLTKRLDEGGDEAAARILIDSQVTHRWPDATGKPADPTRGKSPSWAVPVAR